jgi:hypothetical protein
MFPICRSILSITRSHRNQEMPTFAIEVALGSDHWESMKGDGIERERRELK